MQSHQKIIENLPMFRGRTFKIEKLNGGLTNLNFKISSGKEIYVARFAPYNEAALGISKEIEYKNCIIAYGLGIGPKPVEFYVEHRLLLVEYVSGQVSNTIRIKRRNSIKQLGELFRKLHSGPRFKNSINIFSQTRKFFSTAKKLHSWMPKDSKDLIANLHKIEKLLKNNSWIKPAHLDVMVANMIHTKKGVNLIDWEFSGNADCRFDLAMLSLQARYNKSQDEFLLKSYGAPDFSLRDLELMKCVVALREASWALVQTKMSKIDRNYKKRAMTHINLFNKMAKGLSL